MPPKFAPLTQAIVRQMIKESVDDAIAAEQARHANARNDARGSGPVRGQDAAPAFRECTFVGFMNYNPTVFRSEVTSSRPANLNEAVRMAYKLTEQKSQAKDERFLEGKKRKNARAMTTAPIEKKVSSGTLPVCRCCFTRHDGLCTIKCHKCGKVGHKSRYCKEKSVAMGANA
nr:hypothetical protein [Tanacetum cinerariifolium]